MARLSSDTFEYERRGRVVGEEDYRAVIRARARELLSAGGGRGGAAGRGGGSGSPTAQKAIAGLKAGGPSNESVLKVVNWTKARRSALAQALYAARTREGDPPENSLPMLNEAGHELSGAAIAAEVDSWNLKPDRENLSPAARATFPSERAAMPVNERLHKRQAAHVIFSVPSHTPVDVQRLQQAVSLALRDTVGEGGFRYVSTIHTDHSNRPHAHIIIKATSEPMMVDGREKTKQLRLGPRELEAMRHVFTHHAQEQGIAVVATRREDREHLRAEILAGRAPLRENDRSSAVHRTRQSRAFERAAPHWYAAYGAEYERRRLAAASAEPIDSARDPAPVTAPQKRRGFLERLGASLGIREARGEESAPDAPADGSKAPLRGYFANFRKGRKPTAPELVEDGPKVQGGGAATKRRGNFENVDKERGSIDSGVTQNGGREAAEARVSAHFAVTHRDPEQAAERFRAMLRESPKMALWAAHKHPIAFGEPTGAVRPGLQLGEVRELLPREAQNKSLAPPRRLDPVLAGEQQRIREQTKRVRAGWAAQRAPTNIGHSLARLAQRIEREMPMDSDAMQRAAYLRKIASGLSAPEAVMRDKGHGRERRIEARKKDPSVAYKQLEEQLQHRDQARGKKKMRDRNDGERDR